MFLGPLRPYPRVFEPKKRIKMFFASETDGPFLKSILAPTFLKSADGIGGAVDPWLEGASGVRWGPLGNPGLELDLKGSW